jgi:hypothetical protein
LSSQWSQGLTVLEGHDRIAKLGGASGRRQIRRDALLEFRLQLRGDLVPERGQIRVCCDPGLQVEPISQRKGAVLVLPQPFQNVQSTPPDQSLAPGAELA